LGQVEGTGRMGRITRQDVTDFVEGKQAEVDKEARAPETAERVPDVDEELVPLSKMRRAIAEHMVRSKHQAPHVTTVADVDMTDVAAHREEWKPRLADDGVKLTFTVYMCSAVARALEEFPDLNAEWTDDGLLVKYRINLGLAVSVEDGLVVPVIRDADRLSMRDLARAVEDIAERTRAGKLSHRDLQGGTFTITNPGVFGAVLSTPIIHQPQAAILATGRIADVVAVHHGGIAIRKRQFLSLSYDHRIVDGATAVRFLQRVRAILEACDFPL
ncbi:MAG: dihydrolipoamide acetyltransferase family protein, partial [Planctomycetota bacterium]